MGVEEVSPLSSEFIEVPSLIYKNQPNFTPSRLFEKIVLDRRKNPWLKNRQLNAFIFNKNREIAGRIAIAYIPGEEGRIGFFDAADYESARSLLLHAEKILKENKVKLVEGPVNFGPRNLFWGCLHTALHPVLMGMNFHLPFMSSLFSENGYIEYFRGYVYYRSTSVNLPQKAFFFANNVKASYPDLSLKNYNPALKNKFVSDFVHIYNLAWRHFPDFKPISEEEVLSQMNSFLGYFIEPDATFFIYNRDEPIGFILFVKNYSEILPQVQMSVSFSKLMTSSLTLIKLLTRKIKTRTLLGIAIGIVPAYRNKGIESLFFEKLYENFYGKGIYEGLYLSWIGSFYPSYNNLLKNLGCEPVHIYITYRKALAEGVTITPHQIFY